MQPTTREAIRRVPDASEESVAPKTTEESFIRPIEQDILRQDQEPNVPDPEVFVLDAFEEDASNQDIFVLDAFDERIVELDPRDVHMVTGVVDPGYPEVPPPTERDIPKDRKITTVLILGGLFTAVFAAFLAWLMLKPEPDFEATPTPFSEEAEQQEATQESQPAASETAPVE